MRSRAETSSGRDPDRTGTASGDAIRSPGAGGGPPRSRRRRTLIAFALVIAFIVIGGLVGGKILLHRYESSVNRADLLDPSARADGAAAAGWNQLSGPLNYLLIGSDLRVSNPEGGQRSDSIVIVQVDRTLTHAYLLSIPRDLLVEIPAFPSTGYQGGEDKINSAFQYGGGGPGGIQLLSATLTRLTGLRFDGAAVIDFGGFSRVVDLLGGVEICVEQRVESIHTDRVFEVGCQTMSGAAALDFSRQRYGLTSGDYDRQRHHQQLLKAVFVKARSSGVAYNPLKLDQLLRAVGSSLTVDTGGAALSDLVFSLRDLRPDAMTGVQVPSYPTTLGDTAYALLLPESESLFLSLRAADLATWARENPDWVNRL